MPSPGGLHAPSYDPRPDLAALTGPPACTWLAAPAPPTRPPPARAAPPSSTWSTLLNASPRKKIVEANNLAQKQAIEKYADAEQQKMAEMRKQIMLMPEADPSRRKLETDSRARRSWRSSS